MSSKNSITIKTEEEIDTLRKAGKILSSVIKDLTCSLKPGLTTLEVDQQAEKLIKEKSVIPAFKGYRGFPGCICISVNEEIVHGIPSNRVIKEGDIVSVDCGIIYEEYYSDTATTIAVGSISSELQNLLEVTQESLLKGITQARPGNNLSDISHAVQKFAEANQFSVVREFVGHGIGRSLHEDPEIPNFGPPHQGPVLEEGMVFAIEPMLNLGSWETRILEDGWTVVTADGKPSAHFEHSIAITKDGPEILTI
jgi:methionyl aminopeptidase